MMRFMLNRPDYGFFFNNNPEQNNPFYLEWVFRSTPDSIVVANCLHDDCKRRDTGEFWKGYIPSQVLIHLAEHRLRGDKHPDNIVEDIHNWLRLYHRDEFEFEDDS